MSKTIAQQALSRYLDQVIDEVAEGRETYIIEVSGQPKVVILSLDEYKQLRARAFEAPSPPARIISPRLADPSQAKDFELEVVEEDIYA
ncbi:MAG TPA: type II toxin-antitoxin system Phd/YefM family antitoxin [Chloroflexi bacterium]|nr:type II toxin-antitoxin system Phd/YefM family antitoxin [Chloroflexota bacterium]